MPKLRKQFNDAGLEVEREIDINQNVVKALELDNGRRNEIIGNNIPTILKNVFNDIAGVKGSIRYRALASGNMEYWSFSLRKAGST